jgi:CHASE3 domain sensor protein
MDEILDSFRDFFQAIREINQKYKTPRIKTTRMVTISLLLLRIYLIAMLVLLLYTFISTVIHQVIP